MEINSENILCPYCQSICGGYDDFEGDGFNDESKEFVCDDCGKKFECRRVITVNYRTEMDCELNGEEHEDGKYHCNKCDIYNNSYKREMKTNCLCCLETCDCEGSCSHIHNSENTENQEFNLSEKVNTDGDYNEKDVKEFIRLLKEEFRINTRLPKEISEEIINKLTGGKLNV